MHKYLGSGGGGGGSGDPLREAYLSKQLDIAQNSTLQRPHSNHAISQYQHLSMDSPVTHTARRMSSSSIYCRCKFGIQSKQEAKQDSNGSQKPHNFMSNESRNKCQKHYWHNCQCHENVGANIANADK